MVVPGESAQITENQTIHARKLTSNRTIPSFCLARHIMHPVAGSFIVGALDNRGPQRPSLAQGTCSVP